MQFDYLGSFIGFVRAMPNFLARPATSSLGWLVASQASQGRDPPRFSLAVFVITVRCEGKTTAVTKTGSVRVFRFPVDITPYLREANVFFLSVCWRLARRRRVVMVGYVVLLFAFRVMEDVLRVWGVEAMRLRRHCTWGTNFFSEIARMDNVRF
jgi:hypothetical protein